MNLKKILLGLAALSLILSACANVAQQSNETDTPSVSTTTAPTAEPKGITPSPVQPTEPSDLSTPVSNETPGSGGEGTPSPLDPIPGEENMVRGNVFVDNSEILLLESFPVQINLTVQGNLPTPCHFLRAEVSEPDENGRIDITLYSLTEPGTACILVLQPFETTIPLGPYPSGTYTVYINGEEAGEFEV